MESRIRVTDRALEALRSGGMEPSRSVLVIRHVLGCGGAGYRLTFAERSPFAAGEGVRVAVEGGLVVCMDHYSSARLDGAAIDYDPGKETEGFWLDHADAAFAAFC